MMSIKKPSVDALLHYQACVETTRPPSKKSRLAQSVVAFVEATKRYKALGNVHQLHAYVDASLPAATDDELISLYESQMVRKGSRGRPVYDLILQSAHEGRCPYCTIGAAVSLDHYLPKERFPILSVLSFNLVPSCGDCNHHKRDWFPTDSDEELFHPYFDRARPEKWLEARVLFLAEHPRLDYYPSLAPQTRIFRRLRFQFQMLKLGKLFASNAGAEIAEKKFLLRKILAARGENGVREYLLAESETSASRNVNSWRAVAYAAFASSPQFCKGAFGP